MLKGAVGRRYAKAIFDSAMERGELERWLEDLRLMSAVLSEPRMALFLKNPKIPFEAKKEAIDRSLAQLDKLRLNLIYLLIGRRRTELIKDVVANYEALYNEHRSIVQAEVITAVPLDEAEAKLLAERLSQLSGKLTVELRVCVDESIIGGLIARVGDRLIDGSVKSRLAALRARLMEAAV